jgi:hypothetical protein
MKPRAASQSPYFRRIIDALALVSPFCIAARYEDGFKHCVEASVCGAAALGKRKIRARAIPCAVLAFGKDETSGLSIGFSRRQLYDRMDPRDGPLPPFETWQSEAAHGVPDEESPIHEVIEARFSGETALIDMTIAQLQQTCVSNAERIPLSLAAVGDGWPSFEGSVWTISYMASPHDAQVLARWNTKVNQYSNPTFVADIHDMMDLALSLDLDRDRFLGEMLRRQPGPFAACLGRIADLPKGRA